MTNALYLAAFLLQNDDSGIFGAIFGGPDVLLGNAPAKPHFFAVDFALCCNQQQQLVPQLIELQAFPSMLAMSFFSGTTLWRHCAGRADLSPTPAALAANAAT